MNIFLRVRRNFHIILPLIILVLFLGIVILFFIPIPKESINNFSKYISNWTSLCILLITVIYVVFTGRQIIEVKNQRQHAFQPLPNIKIKYAICYSPELRRDVRTGKPTLICDMVFYFDVTNDGNSNALFVDIFGRIIKPQEMKKGKNKLFSRKNSDSKIIARRINVLKLNENIPLPYSVSEEDVHFLNYLNEGNNGDCPGKKMFNMLFEVNCIYKNIEGLASRIRFLNTLLVKESDKEKISNWLSIIQSFDETYRKDIITVQNTFQRNWQESLVKFGEFKKRFDKENPKDLLIVLPLPIDETYRVIELTEEKYNTIQRENIFHGTKIGASLAKYKDEIEEEIRRVMRDEDNGTDESNESTETVTIDSPNGDNTPISLTEK
jgi:hypothetical protein